MPDHRAGGGGPVAGVQRAVEDCRTRVGRGALDQESPARSFARVVWGAQPAPECRWPTAHQERPGCVAAQRAVCISVRQVAPRLHGRRSPAMAVRHAPDRPIAESRTAESSCPPPAASPAPVKVPSRFSGFPARVSGSPWACMLAPSGMCSRHCSGSAPRAAARFESFPIFPKYRCSCGFRRALAGHHE